jgi:hypothetical protein
MEESDPDLERVRQSLLATERAVERALREHRRSFELLGQPVKDSRIQRSTA